MAQKLKKVNAQNNRIQRNQSGNNLEAIQNRILSEVNRPVEVVDNLPMFKHPDQWVTTQWADLIENYWCSVVNNISKGAIGWLGVQDYQDKEKSGKVVILVDSPLFWNDNYEEDQAYQKRVEVREYFSRALGITIGEVVVVAFPGIKNRKQWKKLLRPFAELPAEVAILPNEWCETSLFVPVKRGRHRFVDGELVARRDGVEVKFTGKELDMKDARVLMAIIRLLKGQPVQDTLETSWRRLAREAGRAKGSWGSNPAKAILTSLERLFLAALFVRGKRVLYNGHLIEDFWFDEATGQLRIRGNPRLMALFQNLNYLQAEYCKEIPDPDLWLYLAVSKDKPGVRQYRQLRDVYVKYARTKDFPDGAYRKWISRVAKPGLSRLQQDGKIKEMQITPNKRGHVASWIVVANSWQIKDKTDDHV